MRDNELRVVVIGAGFGGLEAARTLLREAAQDERAEVTVIDLADKASLQVSVWAPDEPSAERVENELRLRAHARLREAGVFA